MWVFRIRPKRFGSDRIRIPPPPSKFWNSFVLLDSFRIRRDNPVLFQDKGLTDVVLHALLVKEVPATREVLASLPNVFSALCLNTRGLEAFVACRPFERLFQVLLSPDYLPAMRRRRSADPLGDTASNLGNAMDELMRHQPSLKQAATAAIIKLLEQVSHL